MMELNDFLQGGRIAAHLVTVFIVAAYCPDPVSAKRLGISLFAAMVAGVSACLAVSTALNWAQWLELPLAGHICLAFTSWLLLAPVVAGRGNVARLFPRRAWSHRP